MINGTTKSGFKFSVDENLSDNMELLDALADLDGGNSLAFSRVCNLVLGKDQRKKLYDHLRLKDGRVPTTKVEPELTEIINSLNKGKKSETSPT